MIFPGWRPGRCVWSWGSHLVRLADTCLPRLTLPKQSGQPARQLLLVPSVVVAEVVVVAAAAVVVVVAAAEVVVVVVPLVLGT